MAVLMVVYDRKLRAVGFCNSKCYGAKTVDEIKHNHPNKCRCICGGANHAVGDARALKNYQAGIGTRPRDLSAFAQVHRLSEKDLVVVDRLTHSRHAARKIARAHFTKKKSLPLFAYGRLGSQVGGNLKATENLTAEGAQRRRE
jgi:hypothetical protein